ncbi:type II toxin-antitoxin system RelE family toxin [Methanoculleus sp. UBA430]|uniref:type II toxin-antitoxin system RelE family toxin n=1 Tax=Methanoculleus sp. UBA430 TaxID=1915511 RepID=UPI0025D7E6C4|nr:plasmid stabilization protein [Methanoculleus sp. UBA430]
MYELIFSEEALKYLSQIPKKDLVHVKEVISLCLGEFLKTMTRRCNKKLLKGSKKRTYRLHISMTHTVFYRIDDENKRVLIDDVMGINQAHSRYGLY